jgi:hypothetical protein
MDWTAYFDAIRRGRKIVYHVVVDCESGGFVDTIEAGEIGLDEINMIDGLPEYWADICREHYADSRKREHRVSQREVIKTRDSWRAHLVSLTARKKAS